MTSTPTPTRLAIVFTGTCNVCHEPNMTFEGTAKDGLPVLDEAGRPMFECGGCGSEGPAVELATDRRGHDVIEL